jgi:hypothetical protein
MDFYPQTRRSSHDSTHSSASGTTTPHKETASPLSEPLKMSSSAAPSSPSQQQARQTPEEQTTARKNPPIVRYVMDSAPADFSACKHCCQCGTILAISNWCIDCRHFECRNC